MSKMIKNQLKIMLGRTYFKEIYNYLVWRSCGK